MKRVIDGKRYDTTTAVCVCDCSPPGFSASDFRYEDTQLYRTEHGNWFLAGTGGRLSRWARSVDLSGHTNGSGIIPLEVHEARAMLEQHAEAAIIEKYFYKTIEALAARLRDAGHERKANGVKALSSEAGNIGRALASKLQS